MGYQYMNVTTYQWITKLHSPQANQILFIQQQL